MRKKFINFSALIVLMLFLFYGCSVPSIENQTKKTDEKNVLSMNNNQSKVPAQHPSVYEIKLLSTVNEYRNVEIAQNGNEFGALSTEYYYSGGWKWDINFSRISKLGAKIGMTKKITSVNRFELSDFPPLSIVWTGSEYGIAWGDKKTNSVEIYFTRISPSGDKIGNDVLISANDGYDSFNQTLVWTGSEYGLVWEDFRNGNLEIYFSIISESGSEILDDTRISTDDNSDSCDPSLVWTGTSFSIVWEDYRNDGSNIYFAKLNSSGSIIVSERRISDDDAYLSSNPSLVWTGTRYGVTWEDNRDGNGEIYFARISSSGSKLEDNDTRISGFVDYWSCYPSLVWTGTEYGLAWEDWKSGYPEVYFARIDSNGSKIGSDKSVTASDNEFSLIPSLVWRNNEYGVAWLDGRNGYLEVYFARLNSSGNKQAQGGLVGQLTGSQEGYYYIRNYNYLTYLRGSSTPITLREYSSSGIDHIKWSLKDDNNDGYYDIKVKSTGNYLTGLVDGNGNLTGSLGLSSTGGQNINLWKLDSSLDDGKGKYILRIKNDNNKRIYASGETSVDLRSSYDYWQLIPASN